MEQRDEKEKLRYYFQSHRHSAMRLHNPMKFERMDLNKKRYWFYAKQTQAHTQLTVFFCNDDTQTKRKFEWRIGVPSKCIDKARVEHTLNGSEKCEYT